MEISLVRISSAVGVRPMPNLGPCASAALPISITNARALSVREPIGHAPIARDVPRHYGVVQAGDAESFQRLLEERRGLGACRLHRSELVRVTRHDDGLGAVPGPRVAEARMRHPLRSSLDLGFIPLLAAVG